MSYFFRKIKKIKKKIFSAHFLTKTNPTSEWTFFSKKKLQFDFKCVLHLCNYYILCHIFIEKLKNLKKEIFNPFFNQKKSDLKIVIFFEKKIKI